MIKKSQKSQPKADQPKAENIKNKKDPIDSSNVPPKASVKEPQTMDELLAQSTKLPLGVKKGDTVTGTIISISSKEVLLDIGKKSFGIIANWELSQVKDYIDSLKVGESITAQVVNTENDEGFIVLSVRRSSSEQRWTMLTEKKKTGEDIEVMGLEVAKGGLLIEWQSLKGFVPGTQLDSSYSANPYVLISKKIKVKVLEVDKSLNRLVVSQKASSLGISPTILRDKLEKIKTNDVLQGKVAGIAPFGLFVDIDGLEGLVHISEIAWEKVENPSVLYKIGDKVEVVVLEVNQVESKLNLSIKRLTPDPWKNILDRYSPDTQVSGKIVRIAPFGIFVHIEIGIEGLIHISKIPAGIEPKVGQEIACIVEKVDPIKRKMSLTIVPKEKPVGYR